MKPRFFVVALFFFIAVAATPSAAGAPVQGRGLTGPGPHQGAAPGQAPPARQQDRRGPIRYDEEVIVTADREAENIRNIGSSVSVITRDEIAASGARWLIDVLQFAPGVNVVRGGPAGSLAQVFVRGSN